MLVSPGPAIILSRRERAGSLSPSVHPTLTTVPMFGSQHASTQQRDE